MKKLILATLIACSGCAYGQRVNRELYIYAYNDSVTIIDSPFSRFYLDEGDSLSDTFKYQVNTWFYYEINHKPINSVGRGQYSQDYKSYIQYIQKDVLWEVWMDRGRKDYWLYEGEKRRRISFANTKIKRPLLSIH